MNNMIGVMQGRLLPKYKGRYQAHPLGYWQKEFKTAQEINLNCIEFIFDFNDFEENPLLKEGGIKEIKEVSDKTNVAVRTICADYFMEAPLHAESQFVSKKSQQVMIRLLESAKQLNVTDIVIPCVDQSTLKSQKAIDRFVGKLAPILEIAERYRINLSLETDLAPQPFVTLLDRFNSNQVTVNYDIGNSAALGYDSVEELEAYGNKITDIHIKDRLFNGDSVILGEGDAKFDVFFDKLKKFNYTGPFVMQSYRDKEGVEIFKKQLNWIKSYF
jgi:L-ribulose-5-phosphate 3-epimerase